MKTYVKKKFRPTPADDTFLKSLISAIELTEESMKTLNLKIVSSLFSVALFSFPDSFVRKWQIHLLKKQRPIAARNESARRRC
jgi:hypothetical protein